MSYRDVIQVGKVDILNVAENDHPSVAEEYASRALRVLSRSVI